MRPPGSPAESPRRTLAALGLSPRKSLGQNFLADRNVAGKIVALARSFPPPFLEIGPGLGALTSPLADAGAPVVAVEIDRGLAAHLRGRFAGTSRGDSRSGLPRRAGRRSGERRFPAGGTVVGNLPYSISSPIVLRLIELRDRFPRAVLMLQREVVDRLCAGPGGKEYGILSVYLGVLAEARKEFVVRRACFHPAPDVDSAVMSVRFVGEYSRGAGRGAADGRPRRLRASEEDAAQRPRPVPPGGIGAVARTAPGRRDRSRRPGRGGTPRRVPRAGAGVRRNLVENRPPPAYN